MKVEEVMTTQVVSCGQGDALSRAAQLMWEHDCGCVPVLKDGNVVGMITDRDICMATFTRGKAPAEITVGEVASRTVCACAPFDPVEKALHLMQEHQVRRLPVMLDGTLVGIVSLNDFALHAAATRDRAARRREIEQVEETLAAVSKHRTNGAAADEQFLG